MTKLLFSIVFFSLLSTASHAINPKEEALKWKQKGNLVEAIKYFEKAVKLEPSSNSLKQELANATFLVGRYAQAIPLYEDLIITEKNNIQYFIRLAKMYSYSTDKAKSESYAQSALDLEPKDVNDIFMLAEVFYFLKNYPLALNLYEKITNNYEKTNSPSIDLISRQ